MTGSAIGASDIRACDIGGADGSTRAGKGGFIADNRGVGWLGRLWRGGPGFLSQRALSCVVVLATGHEQCNQRENNKAAAAGHFVRRH
jgi:hypothetical protein